MSNVQCAMCNSRPMKDSGIEWIGEIPESWGISKVSNFFEIELGKMLQPNKINEDDSFEYYLCATNVGGNKLKMLPLKQMWFSSDEKFRLGVRQGDLLVVEGGDIASCDIVSEEINNIYYQNALHRVRAKQNQEIRILKYFLWFTKHIGQIDLICNKATIAHFSKEKFMSLPFVVIPIEEQKRIAEFLDKKCGEIDEVIAKTEKTIEEYKALKQSVITEVVTKGIRPNRPMKDSGIEWIGQIPEEWELIPFRHVLFERNEKNNPIISTERLSLSIDLGVTLYADKTTNLDRFKDDFAQYKIARKGDLVMNSMNMIVGASGVSSWLGCVSPVYYTFYDKEQDHITAKFCEYIFRSKTMSRVLYSLGKGIYAIERGDDRVNTCRLKVSKEDLKSIIIPIPNINEQREVVNYISSRCAEIDKLIESKQQLLTELETYKKSVIYEYVTGKKEVE